MNSGLTSYTNFLYIFPCAIWVNQIAPEFVRYNSPLSIALYVLMFIFIPAELVSSALWQKLSILGPRRKDGHDFQAGLLSLIDIFRIFCLTVFFATVTALTHGHSGDPWVMGVVISAIGGFLCFNFIWNKVEAPQDISVFDTVQQKLNMQVQAAASSAMELGARFILSAFGVYRQIQSAFIWIIFPLFGLIALVVGGSLMLSGARQVVGGVGFLAAGLEGFLLILFVLQVSFKSVQVAALSYVASYLEILAEGRSQTPPLSAQIVEVDIATMTVSPSRRVNMKTIAELRWENYRADRSRTYPGLVHLLKDSWDEVSIHIIATDGAEFVGVGRLTPAREGKLPVSEESAFTRPVRTGEYELSRFLIHPEWRRTRAVLAIFAGVVAELRKRPDAVSVYADIIVEGADVFSRRRFERMGFQPIDINYIDGRYGSRSEVLKLSEPDFPKFYAYIDGLVAGPDTASMADTGTHARAPA